MDAMNDLWPENMAAWTLFHQVACRFSVDFHATPPMLAAVLRECDAEESLELLQRLSVIYDTVYPPPPKKTN